MRPELQKQEIRRATEAYARKHNKAIDDSHASAIIFRNLADNFHPESFSSISNRSQWKERTTKPHPNLDGAFEMQSSNSSDALLMNIFCHPAIIRWKGVSDMLGVALDSIDFGCKAKIGLTSGQVDSTEIDLVLPGIFCEAKLTESDFTTKRSEIVLGYANLANVFHVESLPLVGKDYAHYQVIRNLLAAIQHDRRHVLLCDERRPDLVRNYMDTVSCLREMADRARCRVIFWQELASVCGVGLQEWIREKYGMT